MHGYTCSTGRRRMRDRLILTNWRVSWPSAHAGSESHFARIRFVRRPTVWPDNAERCSRASEPVSHIRAWEYGVESCAFAAGGERVLNHSLYRHIGDERDRWFSAEARGWS